jgi:hypothetical protein
MWVHYFNYTELGLNDLQVIEYFDDLDDLT